MYDNHFAISDVSVSRVLGSMAMTLPKFIEVLRPPPSPKMIENTCKVLHPLSQLTGTDFNIFVTRLT